MEILAVYAQCLEKLKRFWGEVKAVPKRVSRYLRTTGLGRFFWAISNAGKDFKTQLPKIEFVLTQEQAKYAETCLCDLELGTGFARISEGCRAFYDKYPRASFGFGGDPDYLYEGCELVTAAIKVAYVPTEVSARGNPVYSITNPFIKMMGRCYQESGGAMEVPSGKGKQLFSR